MASNAGLCGKLSILLGVSRINDLWMQTAGAGSSGKVDVRLHVHSHRPSMIK
jgi:hypothetical protein